jgi:hypothetical protein
MIGLLVTFLVLLIIFSLFWWIVTVLPLPEPIGRIARVVVVVLFCIILIYMLLPYAGGFGGHPLLRN